MGVSDELTGHHDEVLSDFIGRKRLKWLLTPVVDTIPVIKIRLQRVDPSPFLIGGCCGLSLCEVVKVTSRSTINGSSADTPAIADAGPAPP
ncbi:MAG: hypothetical protein L0L17_11660, partial [Yaniella sp.]|nr:hypothetical protein [Yaniella sp.]